MPDFSRLLLAALLGAVLALGGSVLFRADNPAGDLNADDQATELAVESTGSPELDQQIRIANLELSQQQLRDELAALRRSLAGGEQQAPDAAAFTATTAPGPANQTTVATADGLIAAGISSADAQLMVERLDALALARLEADFRVRKETGDAGQQARQDRRAIPRDRDVIRSEFGDTAYDQYLYSLNQPNRVEVSSVLRDSAAQNAGVQDGDFLRSLDGEPLFSVRDLTRQIREGDAERTYRLQVERGGQVIETWVPGGPLGVRVSGTVAEPGNG